MRDSERHFCIMTACMCSLSPLVGAARGRLGEETRSDRDREVRWRWGGDANRERQAKSERDRAEMCKPPAWGRDKCEGRKYAGLATESREARGSVPSKEKSEVLSLGLLPQKFISGNPRKPLNVPFNFMQIYQIHSLPES